MLCATPWPLCGPKLINLGGHFDLDALNERITENEGRMAEPGFWDDSEAAQKVIDNNNALKEKHDRFYALENELEDLEAVFELLQDEPDKDLQQEEEENIKDLK